jgi:hypothetical protein
MSDEPKKEEPEKQANQDELTDDDLDQVAGGTRAPIDVCKVPSGPSPVPIPYPTTG